MNIQLAGYNTDVQNGGNTPETLSASYARISRDPRPINVLRKEAAGEVKKARASNRRIIFDYGHGSVAEHAVFNFDILDVSRLAAEELQSFRLASFTEKSQRYIRIGEDLILPPELDDSSGFRETASGLFQLYNKLYDGLLRNGLKKDNAKEDARYILPLATSCQMGMTVNARELEHMVRRLSCHPFAEVRMIAGKLLELAMDAAPSLFLFLEPTAMDLFSHSMSPVESPQSDSVVLLDCDDDSKVGPLLVQWNSGLSIKTAGKKWAELGEQGREGLFAEVLSGIGIHDSLPRIWEFFRAEFQLILSATAYAQLKRHRLCTRLVSVYDPILGVTVPQSISDAGLEEEFLKGTEEAEKTAGTLEELYPYMLTNANRRRVILSMNGRELHHFSRLREDAHAQWDIREIAHRMMLILKEKAPLTFMISGGKSEVSDLLK
ncbi:MAG: FAD-dependent thymidylate synthase [Candidatus Aegiribacteria sp.]|nr:FAD-dependent thymidylate synthase [Candidatus Aegiribacteria sp.]